MGTPPVAIFAALADEIRITRSKMQIDESILVRPARIACGQYRGVPLVIVRTGVGTVAMAEAVSYTLRQRKSAICINVGYCGGASPDMQVGDILIANRIVDGPTSEEFIPPKDLVDEAEQKCEAGGLRHSVGGMVTVEKPVSEPHDKAFIGTKHEIRGIEMESAAFARVCEEHEVPYVVVRAVLDPMDMILPDFEGAVDEEGETSILGAMRHMIRRPKDILAIPRIEYCAIQAREAIAKFIDVWLGI